MSQPVVIELEVPEGLKDFRMPERLHNRLQGLLDKQDRGDRLSEDERQEAEALVDIAEFLTLLRLRAERAARKGPRSA